MSGFLFIKETYLTKQLKILLYTAQLSLHMILCTSLIYSELLPYSHLVYQCVHGEMGYGNSSE